MNFPRPSSTATLFGFSFLTAATYVLTRALGVSLFLSRMGSDALPLALGASAIAVIAVSTTTRLLVRYVPIRLCVMFSWLALAAISLLLSTRIVALPNSLYVVGMIYVLTEIRGSLNTVYVTTLANDQFSASTSKRPFVLLASGAPVAGIIAGFLLSYEAKEVSDTAWLSIIAGLDLLTMLVTFLLPRKNPAPQSADLDRSDEVDGQKRPMLGDWRNYRYALAALVATKVIVLTLLGYQWQVVTSDFLQSEAKMISFFAAFYAISDVLIVLAQLSASGLLDRIGIGVPLKLYPMGLALIGIAALVAPSLTILMIVYTIGSGLNVLRRSFHDPGLAAAYAVLNPRVRSETIVLITGMIKPFAEVVAALGLLFFADVVSPDALTCVWILLLVPWYLFARWVSRRYAKHIKSFVRSS